MSVQLGPQIRPSRSRNYVEPRYYGAGASVRSSPNPPIRPDIAIDAVHAVVDRRHSIRSIIAAATSSNAGSAT